MRPSVVILHGVIGAVAALGAYLTVIEKNIRVGLPLFLAAVAVFAVSATAVSRRERSDSRREDTGREPDERE